MKQFLKDNYIKLLLLLFIALLFVFWARVLAAQVEKNNYFDKLVTNEDRIHALTYFGWEVAPELVEEKPVTIPETFDDTWQSYNMLQKEAGFDLTKYQGKEVMRYTYQLRNFPMQVDQPVYVNILVFEGRLIGGDCMVTDLQGFMLPLDPKAHT